MKFQEETPYPGDFVRGDILRVMDYALGQAILRLLALRPMKPRQIRNALNDERWDVTQRDVSSALFLLFKMHQIIRDHRNELWMLPPPQRNPTKDSTNRES